MISAAVARELAALGFVDYGGVGSTGVPCGLEDMPDTPDIAVAVITRSSFPREYQNWQYARPEFQVVVRHPGVQGARSRPGYSLCERILWALDGDRDQVWAASTVDEVAVYQCLANASAPLPLGPDVKQRPRWSVSFQLEVLISEASA